MKVLGLCPGAAALAVRQDLSCRAPLCSGDAGRSFPLGQPWRSCVSMQGSKAPAAGGSPGLQWGIEWLRLMPETASLALGFKDNSLRSCWGFSCMIFFHGLCTGTAVLVQSEMQWQPSKGLCRCTVCHQLVMPCGHTSVGLGTGLELSQALSPAHGHACRVRSVGVLKLEAMGWDGLLGLSLVRLYLRYCVQLWGPPAQEGHGAVGVDLVEARRMPTRRILPSKRWPLMPKPHNNTGTRGSPRRSQARLQGHGAGFSLLPWLQEQEPGPVLSWARAAWQRRAIKTQTPAHLSPCRTGRDGIAFYTEWSRSPEECLNMLNQGRWLQSGHFVFLTWSIFSSRAFKTMEYSLQLRKLPPYYPISQLWLLRSRSKWQHGRLQQFICSSHSLVPHIIRLFKFNDRVFACVLVQLKL